MWYCAYRTSGSGGELPGYLGERQRRLVDQFIGRHGIDLQRDAGGVDLIRLENFILPGS
jgi:hypothetical protein